MRAPIAPDVLAPGFDDPVFDAQGVFRAVLEAFSFPGRIATVAAPREAPGHLDRATTAIALTLVDSTTPLWLESRLRSREVESYLRFHCGCPLVDSAELGTFSIVTIDGEAPRLQAFAQGSDLYPDRSGTVIFQVPALRGGPIVPIRGPGIDGEAALEIAGLPEWFWESWQTNHQEFPCGVDVLFTSETELAALPRSIAATPDLDMAREVNPEG